MRCLVLALGLVFLFVAPAPAGQAEGMAAYNRKDFAAAFKEFEPLAKAGNAEAQNWLGTLYFHGHGVPKDFAQALIWFGRAAEQNQPQALNNLGQLHFNGTGLPKDEAKGLEYLHRAADQGVAASWETIGMAYWHGRSVPQDKTKAVPWLKKAAEHGLMVAQNLYGAALWTGEGGTQDKALALKLFEAAGNQGDASSLYNLGLANQQGVGTAKDLEKGYYYLILAERLAKPADKARFGQARDTARAQVNPDQEKRAQQQAAAWTPAKGRPISLTPATAPTPLAPAKPGESAPPRPQVMAGTGILVTADGVVLTNSHVVPNCRNIRVTPGEGGEAQAASVLARNATDDLALLKSTLTGREPARFREDKPLRSGDEVVVVGFPLSSLLSREPNVTAGVVSALAGIRGDKRHYQITAPVQKGNSGGPLADASGNIIGIVASKLNAMKIAGQTGDLPQNVNFAIKSELARSFMTQNGVAYKTAPAGPPMSAADIGERLRKVTVFVECEG